MNLTKIADKSGKTREELASAMGVSRMQMHRYLTHPRKLSIDKLELLSQVLNKPIRIIIKHLL